MDQNPTRPSSPSQILLESGHLLPDHSSNPHPKPESHVPISLPASKLQTAIDWFLWEALSIVVATLSLGGIAGVLFTFNNKTSPQWPVGITINSILSWLSTISRATMLVPISKGIAQLKWVWFSSEQRLADLERFDDASRGPLGSLLLLWRFKNSIGVACFPIIGALATILMLGLDPFIQQIIEFNTREVPSTNTTSKVTRANFFYERPSGAKFQPSQVTLRMKSALYNGIFESATAQPSFECASGSCTWPLYSSLAVCSLCTDLTPQLTLHCETESPWCNLTLPFASAPDLQSIRGDVLHANTSIPSELYSFNGPLLNFIGIAGAFLEWQLSNTSKVLATECVLVACVNTYRSSVIEGVYNEEIVSTYTNYTGITNDWYSGRGNVTLTPVEKASWDDSTQYNFEQLTYFAIKGYLASFLSGDVRSFTGSRQFSSDAAQAFWEAESFAIPLENLAVAMTKVIRDWNNTSIDGTNLSPMAEGKVWMRETYVTVRWIWLILPVLLLILSAAEFAGALVSTRRVAGLRMWRSSSLALLVHGLDKDTLKAARNAVRAGTKDGLANSQGGIFEVADEIIVRLDASEQGIIEFHGR